MQHNSAGESHTPLEGDPGLLDQGADGCEQPLVERAYPPGGRFRGQPGAAEATRPGSEETPSMEKSP